MTRNLLLITVSTLLLTWATSEAQQISPKKTEQQKLFVQKTNSDVRDPFSQKRKKSVSSVVPSFRAQEIRGDQYNHARQASSHPIVTSKLTSILPSNSHQSSKPFPHTIVYGEDGHLPILIKGEFSGQPLSGPTARTSITAASHEFLDQVKDDMRIRQPQKEFTVASVETDRTGSETRADAAVLPGN